MEEQQKYEIVKESLKGELKIKEAAMLLNLSVKQVYRLRKKVKEIRYRRSNPSYKRKTFS